MKKVILGIIASLSITTSVSAEQKREVPLSQTGAGSSITVAEVKKSKNDTAKAKVNFEALEQTKEKASKRKIMVSTSGAAGSIALAEKELK